jgi:hypothetical protein
MLLAADPPLDTPLAIFGMLHLSAHNLRQLPYGEPSF